MPMGGNPWANAAASYGQDLDQFGQIKMQGMQQAAQAPLSLYDRFMDGYEKARARAMQEKQMEMAAANQQRQMLLAENTLQHNRETEAFNRSRLSSMDQRDATKEAMDALGNYNARVSGLESPVKALFRRAGLGEPNLPTVEGGQGGEELPGPTQPGEEPLVRQPWEDELSGYGPTAREKRVGQIRLERKDETDALDRAERMAQMGSEKEKDRELRREIASQASKDRMVLGGLAASGRNDAIEARKEAKNSEKRVKYTIAESKVNDAVADIDSLIEDIDALKNHPNLKNATGALGIIYRKIPDTQGKTVDTLVNTIRDKTLLSTMSKLKALTPTGSTGFGALNQNEGETMRNSLVNWDMSVPYEELLARADRAKQLLETAKARTLANQKNLRRAYFPDEEEPSVRPATNPDEEKALAMKHLQTAISMGDSVRANKIKNLYKERTGMELK